VNAPAADGVPTLIFHWEPPRGRRLTLVGFLVASLLGHACCFYLFQIVYPPTVAVLLPPARINLISARSEEGRNVLQWIEAEDPALAFVTQRTTDSRLRALPKVEHVPSYVVNEPTIQQLPPLTMEVRTPSAQPPAPVPIIRAKPAPPIGERSTQVSFSSELSGLGAATCPQTKFTATTNEAPQTAQFRLAVNARGAIQHCFIMNSSSDASLDEQARQHLLLCRITATATVERAAEQRLTWGIATINWGTDVERPEVKPANAVGAK
jgi:hypothetical protein